MMEKIAKAGDETPVIKFKPCRVVTVDDRRFFVWPISEETRGKIRHLLGEQHIEFKFNSTLEQVPPFFCPECDAEITFADNVRAALTGSPHGRSFLLDALRQTNLKGSGVAHQVTCENNHVQPVVLGWALINWIYAVEE